MPLVYGAHPSLQPPPLDYVTCPAAPASHFQRSQLKEAVCKQPHVLKDQLERILIARGLLFNFAEQIMLTLADVKAIYPVTP